jgi:hypothetical protein
MCKVTLSDPEFFDIFEVQQYCYHTCNVINVEQWTGRTDR